MTFSPTNPYVGPRSFQPGEPIYGRDRELRDLAGLLIAERIVLLLSPSGAGKTSLIQAALIPRLQENDFTILPIVRLSLAPPAADPDSAAEQAEAAPNRYIRSTIISLEEGLPAEEQLPLAELAHLSLDEYLRARDKRLGKRDAVLIFDQFEEILTIDPLALEAKHAFFTQLGQALRDKRRWALFAMREEFVARLEPFVRPVPTRLSSSFRLDLLDPQGAMAAIRQPALAQGVAFDDAAARSLVDDLRRSQVQRPDGGIEAQLGPNVEPVQLQVVCYRLWERLFGGGGTGGQGDGGTGGSVPQCNSPLSPSERSERVPVSASAASGLVPVSASAASGPLPAAITPADVQGVGDVDRSLAEYYAERVAEAARLSGVAERRIREWFDRRLITPQGIRGQVLRGAEAGESLPGAAVRPLLESFLVRAEQRRGLTWFELAHDRLIGPIRQDNAAWSEANLSPLQRQADLWARQGRPEGLLLRDVGLAEAERWAAARDAELTADERDFLEASRRLREVILRARRQNQRIRWLALIASAFSVVALIALAVAYQALQAAQREGRQAQARGLAAGATNQINSDPELALILAQQAALATRNAGEPVEASAQTALYQALAASRVRQTWALDEPSGGVAISPDGATLAIGGADGTITLLSLADGQRRTLGGHGGPVLDLAFSPDGAALASAGDDRTARLWDPASGALLQTFDHPAPLHDLDLSPDGALLATAAEDGVPRIWRLSDGSVRALPPHHDIVTGVAFSPDGRQLASVSRDTRALIFDLGSGRPADELMYKVGFSTVAFSPDGTTIALGTLGPEILIWRIGADELVQLRGHTDQAISLSFSPDGGRLISVGGDTIAQIWGTQGQPIETLLGHSAIMLGAVFAPDGAGAYTLADDGTVQSWDLGGLLGEPSPALARSPDGALMALGRPTGQIDIQKIASGQIIARLSLGAEPITALAFSHDGSMVAAADADGQLALWDLRDDTTRWQAQAPYGGLALAFSPDGRLLFAASDRTLTAWDVGDGQAAASYTADEAISGIAVNPAGAQVALITEAEQIVLWDYASGAVAGARAEPAVTGPIVYSPDGRLLAMQHAEGGLLLRTSADLSPIGLVIAPGAQVAALAFSPDGAQLAVADATSVITIWDAASGAELLSISEPVTSLALFFDDGGASLVSNGGDGVLRSYPLDIEQALALADLHITRAPNAIECGRYYLGSGAGC